MNVKTQREREKPLKMVYKNLYGSKEQKIVSDTKLENFKWTYVSAKEKK